MYLSKEKTEELKDVLRIIRRELKETEDRGDDDRHLWGYLNIKVTRILEEK